MPRRENKKHRWGREHPTGTREEEWKGVGEVGSNSGSSHRRVSMYPTTVTVLYGYVQCVIPP